MYDAVSMTIVQCTSDLTRKFTCHSFSQPSVADDVVQHLPTVDIFEHHIVMVLVHDHLAHATNVGMMQEHRQRGFAQSPDLLGCILRGLFRCSLRTCGAGVGKARVYSGKNFDSKLRRTPYPLSKQRNAPRD